MFRGANESGLFSLVAEESIKIIVRFMSNEIRSDSVRVKIFYKNCKEISNCKIIENKGNLKNEINTGLDVCFSK